MPFQPGAVVFDYGNVLCAPQEPTDIAAMARVFRMAPGDFHPIYWRYRLPYDKSDLDPRSYWETVAREANRELTPDQIAELSRLDVESWARPAPRMPDWARQLHAAGMRTGLLSNMPGDLRRHVTAPGSWLPEFDHLTFSCDVRLVKPGREIYEYCLAGLGAKAEETLFFDDRPENIAAAGELGIHTVLYTTPDAAKTFLEGRYLLPVALA